jgi:DNA-binding MarR family transcriptional regulator
MSFTSQCQSPPGIGASASNAVNEQGFVLLTPDEKDRRQVIVTPTRAGERRLSERRHHRAAGTAGALRDQLDPDERELLRRVPGILRKLRAAPNEPPETR